MKARFALALVLLAPAAAADVTPIQPLPSAPLQPITVVKPACTLVYSGGATASFPCTVTAVFDQKSNRSTVVVAPSAQQSVQIMTSVWAPGELKVGTLTGTTTGVGFSAIYQQAGGAVLPSWLATNQGAATGSLSTTITSVTTTTTFTGGHAYAVHGSTTGTLPSIPSTGASGTVTMSATF